jgi:hypothetical protein
MDAGNRIGPEGAASLASVLEKMTQLTALNFERARARFCARPRGAWGVFVVIACFWGTCLDALWLGYALEGGDACDGLRGVC